MRFILNFIYIYLSNIRSKWILEEINIYLKNNYSFDFYILQIQKFDITIFRYLN